MSTKLISLGRVNGGNMQEGLRTSNGTNATPIVLTMGSTFHGIKRGDHVIVGGITGLTGANGEWRVASSTATTISLEGSIGNGVFGGTATLRQICDVPPFIKGNDASAFIAALDNYDGTVILEGSTDDIIYNTAIKGIALTTGQDNLFIEVSLARYMRFQSTVIGTVGSVTCQIMSSS